MTYAGFWKRFAAYLIDTIIIGFVMGIIMMVFGVGLFTSMATMDEMTMDEGDAEAMAAGMIGGMMTLILVASAAQWLYFALMESSAKQGTLGKMALSIIVTDANGNRISFGRATGRYFGKIISGAILCIGYIMAGFTEKKQALHDMIAGCLVVNK
ncbi:MAG TPA: RDD family protein [Bacteroidota bacterium]|nr:RDD family protein [Bacteroidota bacterium]